MKYLFCLLIAGMMWSGCHKKDIQNNEEIIIEDNVQNYLNFDIRTIDYSSSDTMEFELIETVQKLSYGFRLKTNADENRYLWFTGFNVESNSDSATIIASIRYEFENSMDFEFKYMDIEFVYKEALEHLVLNSDDYYKYEDLSVFYDRLMNLDWDKNGYGVNKSQLMLTLLNEGVQEYVPSSNGFYFEDENLVLDHISFDSELNQIKFEGNFNVYIKELSCGFYMTHQIKNAKFMGIIN